MSTSKAKMASRDTISLYYRLAKPGIIYANVLTAVAGYLFAAKLHIALDVMGGLLIGLVGVIAGACAYNNYLDRGIDIRMKRTSKRGTVTGEIAGWQALTFATLSTGLGLAITFSTQNMITCLLVVIAFVDYVILYGFAKRHSVHGTLVGCVSGAIPLVAGYKAVVGRLDLTAALLFALMVVWQMAHFYGIALYRLKDYAAAKIPVMPAVYGEKSTQWQALVYIGLFIAIVTTMALTHSLGVIASGLLAVLGVVWLYRSARQFRGLAADIWGRQMFLFSLIVMLGMSVLLAADPLLV